MTRRRLRDRAQGWAPADVTQLLARVSQIAVLVLSAIPAFAHAAAPEASATQDTSTPVQPVFSGRVVDEGGSPVCSRVLGGTLSIDTESSGHSENTSVRTDDDGRFQFALPQSPTNSRARVFLEITGWIDPKSHDPLEQASMRVELPFGAGSESQRNLGELVFAPEGSLKRFARMSDDALENSDAPRPTTLTRRLMIMISVVLGSMLYSTTLLIASTLALGGIAMTALPAWVVAGTLAAAAQLCVQSGHEVAALAVLIDLGLVPAFSWRALPLRSVLRYG